MNANFFEKDGTEFVSLTGGFLGKDEVIREATEDDKRQYGDEYTAYRTPTATEAPTATAEIVGPKVGAV